MPDVTATQPAGERLAYSPDEVAALTGLGRTKVYELLEAGSIVSIKVGRRRLISRTALVEFLDRGCA